MNIADQIHWCPFRSWHMCGDVCSSCDYNPYNVVKQVEWRETTQDQWDAAEHRWRLNQLDDWSRQTRGGRYRGNYY